VRGGGLLNVLQYSFVDRFHCLHIRAHFKASTLAARIATSSRSRFDRSIPPCDSLCRGRPLTICVPGHNRRISATTCSRSSSLRPLPRMLAIMLNSRP
jgi:hypothetical protein